MGRKHGSNYTARQAFSLGVDAKGDPATLEIVRKLSVF